MTSRWASAQMITWVNTLKAKTSRDKTWSECTMKSATNVNDLQWPLRWSLSLENWLDDDNDDSNSFEMWFSGLISSYIAIASRAKHSRAAIRANPANDWCPLPNSFHVSNLIVFASPSIAIELDFAFFSVFQSVTNAGAKWTQSTRKVIQFCLSNKICSLIKHGSWLAEIAGLRN